MNWQIFFSTFGLVFLAELGDKTQLAVMTQTCKFRRPWPVFFGGSLALTAVTALGAAGGQLIGALIPVRIVQIIAAAAFVVMGVLIWREAGKNDKEAECADETTTECAGTGGWNWKAFGTTFSLLFFAELGDKTQLAVLSLSSKQAAPWIIFAGGALALTAVTALGVVGGQQLSKWIPERILLRVSAAAFVVMGILIGAGIL
ncbi:MAG: TMEM165/GDT1 family protein [Anaerolineae bacterium]|nr:TMEM165/GDT1 family protein [Anaerolineae bacterium]